MSKSCSTCGRQVLAATDFLCPGCGKTRIVRCPSCRQAKNKYSCRECGFEGP
ncbi:MAG: zinc finger domain-containing protein [Candidatus Micrarchaeota archaeon]